MHSIHGYAEKFNISNVLSLQHVPIMGIPMPKDYINSKWIYNTSELTHTDMGSRILDEIDKELDELAEHKEKMSHDMTTESNNKWWNIFGIFETNVFSGIYVITVWIERILVIYLIWKVINKKRKRYRRARENDASDN